MSTLPPRPSLEHLKGQAKDLLAAFRSNDADAVRRLMAHHPRFEGASASEPSASSFTLSDAQLVVAREHGFPSWPRLKAHVEWLLADARKRAALFVTGACSENIRRSVETLRTDPSMAGFDLFTALVTGEVETVTAALARDASAATRAAGPLSWEPLLYVAHSRFLQRPEHAEGMLRCARLLLEHGADPNAAYEAGYADAPPQTAIYGAAGVNHNAELTRLLLEAGADPNDNESLYHAAESPDHVCMTLLMEHGIRPEGTNALKRKLDYDDLEGARLLLEYGTDPNEYTPGALHHAIQRGRDVATIELLLSHGADVNARAQDGTTPYVMAVRYGRTEVAEALLRHGALDETTGADRFIAACARADRAEVERIRAVEPDIAGSLSGHAAFALLDMCDEGNTDAVRLLLEAGCDPAVMRHGIAPLHFAGWKGDLATVEALLDHGAPLEQVNAFGGTVLGSTIHGSVHYDGPGADYPAVVRRLVAAGAVVPPGGFPDAIGPVAEALAGR